MGLTVTLDPSALSHVTALVQWWKLRRWREGLLC